MRTRIVYNGNIKETNIYDKNGKDLCKALDVAKIDIAITPNDVHARIELCPNFKAEIACETAIVDVTESHALARVRTVVKTNQRKEIMNNEENPTADNIMPEGHKPYTAEERKKYYAKQKKDAIIADLVNFEAVNTRHRKKLKELGERNDSLAKEVRSVSTRQNELYRDKQKLRESLLHCQHKADALVNASYDAGQVLAVGDVSSTPVSEPDFKQFFFELAGYVRGVVDVA